MPPLVRGPPAVLEHAEQAGRLSPLLGRQGQPGPREWWRQRDLPGITCLSNLYSGQACPSCPEAAPLKARR